MPTFYGTDVADTQTTLFDVLYGGDGDDRLIASIAGPAYLEGGRGDDAIGSNGLAGATEAYGGAGDDSVVGHTSADSLFGGTGNDLIVGSGALASVDGVIRTLVPSETSGADFLEGNAGQDAIYGFDGNDVILGGDGDDRGLIAFSAAPGALFVAGLFGGSGKDFIDGGSDDDLISGGAGKDTLVGGRGEDTFLFDKAPVDSNVDTILDFSHKDDSFELDPDIFTKVGSPGFFPPGAFFQGKHAHDRSDRIIYDPGKGLLLYDPNGDKSGQETVIAKLAKGLDLAFDDFFMSA